MSLIDDMYANIARKAAASQTPEGQALADKIVQKRNLNPSDVWLAGKRPSSTSNMPDIPAFPKDVVPSRFGAIPKGKLRLIVGVLFIGAAILVYALVKGATGGGSAKAEAKSESGIGFGGGLTVLVVLVVAVILIFRKGETINVVTTQTQTATQTVPTGGGGGGGGGGNIATDAIGALASLF